jgi:hypothetical protein
VLFYEDACSRFGQIDSFYKLAVEHDLTGIQLPNKQVAWTKADAFVLLDACDESHNDTLHQRAATALALRNCERVRNFVDLCLLYCQDPRIITDQPNQMGQENHQNFQEHRHDQSVFSILTHKLNIGHFVDWIESIVLDRHHICGFCFLEFDLIRKQNGSLKDLGYSSVRLLLYGTVCDHTGHTP